MWSFISDSNIKCKETIINYKVLVFIGDPAWEKVMELEKNRYKLLTFGINSYEKLTKRYVVKDINFQIVKLYERVYKRPNS